VETVIGDPSRYTFGERKAFKVMGIINLEYCQPSFFEKMWNFVEKGVDKKITFGTTIQGYFWLKIFDGRIQASDIFGGNVGQIGENQVKLNFWEVFKKIGFQKEEIFRRMKQSLSI